MLHGQAGVPRYTAHRECIDRIVARDDHNTLTVAHDDVLTLAHDPETSLFECSHGDEVIDARNLGQGLDSHFDFANFLAAELLIDNRQVFADRVFDIFQRFHLCDALRPTSR